MSEADIERWAIEIDGVAAEDIRFDDRKAVVRAVLRAIREPTAAMLLAGHEAVKFQFDLKAASRSSGAP